MIGGQPTRGGVNTVDVAVISVTVKRKRRVGAKSANGGANVTTTVKAR